MTSTDRKGGADNTSSAPSAKPDGAARALLLIVAACATIIAWELKPKAPPAPYAPPAPLVNVVVTNTPASGTNWEYTTMDARDQEGMGLIFLARTNDFPGYSWAGYTVRDGRFEDAEANLLDYWGHQGWELVSSRASGDRMFWTFKRPRK
jgi:hypothetical protein